MPEFEEWSLPLPDGTTAYARFWPARAADTSAVLFLHGIQSHCGWYERSARHLAHAGHNVLQVDRRGCGRNSHPRGHAESPEQLLNDAAAARDALLRRTGQSRYHLVGASWGGKLAVAFYVSDPKGIASLSLTAPGLFPNVGASKDEMARIGFAMLYEPERSFRIPLDEPAYFSKDPRWQEFIARDPLTLRECTAGFYLASRRLDRLAVKLPQSGPVPIQVLLAGDERIVDNPRTEAFFRELAWPQCRLTPFPGARHSLEFEDCAERYLEELEAFIARCPALPQQAAPVAE